MSETVLTTVLFTDIVGSSELAAKLGNARWRDLLTRHHALVREELERFRGREIDTAGDGFLATFDAPGRAVLCASAIRESMRPLGVRIRAGVHTGECEVMGEKLGGIAVHIGARVAAEADADEILVSSTVKDLMPGSEIRFEDRGLRALKGVPGEWHLFAVERRAPGVTRIQLCGRIVAELEGRRVEEALPGRQGRLLFAYLVANRVRPCGRDELIEALWPYGAPAGAETSLSALLSKLRRALGPDALQGRSTVQLRLPSDAWIDLEAAGEAIHRAESALAQEDWAGAWGPGRVAQHIAKRGFLPGEDAPWVDERRRHLEELYLRALEITAEAGLMLGGTEIDTAERSGRSLVERAPFRESGYCYLMQVLAARGNVAEALRVYEQLRRLLRDELGTAPGPAAQELHKRLLTGSLSHMR